MGFKETLNKKISNPKITCTVILREKILIYYQEGIKRRFKFEYDEGINWLKENTDGFECIIYDTLTESINDQKVQLRLKKIILGGFDLDTKLGLTEKNIKFFKR